MYQASFKRHEIKYVISIDTYYDIKKVIESHMSLDVYGLTHIRNIYYDTSNYYLIRNSILKPIYKEKLRLRSYHKCESDTEVFLELKKKYKSVVYKRRIKLPYEKMKNYLDNKIEFDSFNEKQIDKEIKYFFEVYKSLAPRLFLSYDRVAYFDSESDLRITFDSNIKYRTYDLDLKYDTYGDSILSDDLVIMEIKTAYAMPLWLTEYLNKNNIYKQSFSKYGNCYLKLVKEGEIKI